MLKVKEGTARMTFLEGYELLDQIGESPFGDSTDFLKVNKWITWIGFDPFYKRLFFIM